MDVTFFYGALLLYFTGTVAYLLLFSLKRGNLPRVATAATIGGFLLHTSALLLRLYTTGRPPLTNLYEALSFFAWATVLVYLALEFRFQRKVMGAFVLPIILLATAAASVAPKGGGGLAPAIKSTWIWLHVIFVLLGNAAFALTFGVGLMYLLQERQLKTKSLGPMSHRLPSLEFLDLLGYRTLIVGFPLLTAGLITGSIQAQYAWGSFLTWDPTQILSLLTWVIYAGLLQARIAGGWRGRKAAILSIIGFCGVLVTFLGINFMARGPHTFN